MKIGEKIKLISYYYGEAPGNPVWGGRHGEIEGTVTNVGAGEMPTIWVNWDNGKKNTYMYKHLKLVDYETPLDDLMDFINKELVI
jgi:hypothetical protein